MRERDSKRTACYAAICAVTLLTIAGLAFFTMGEPSLYPLNPVVERQINSHAGKLETGDIIFRRENSFWGDVSASVARRDGKFSHVGIIRRDGDDIYVIHSYANPEEKSSIVKEQSLNQFAANALDIGFYRLDFTAKEREDIAFAARKHAESETPFDPEFSLASEEKLYCSELIWRSAQSVLHIDIAPEKSKAFGQDYIGNDDLFLGGFMREI